MELADQWNELCQRYEKAQQDAMAARSVVNKKFGEIASGKKHMGNPTDEEIKASDDADAAVKAIDAEMREFTRKHLGR
jgi:hypothetical protein